MPPIPRFPALAWPDGYARDSGTADAASDELRLEQANRARALVLPLLARIAPYLYAIDTANVIARAVERASTSTDATLWVPGPEVCGRWCVRLTGIAPPAPGHAVIARCDEFLNALLVRAHRVTGANTANICERHLPPSPAGRTLP